MAEAGVGAAGAEFPERVAHPWVFFREDVGEKFEVGGMRTAGEAAEEDENVGGIGVATLVGLEEAIGVVEGGDAPVDDDLKGGRHGGSCLGCPWRSGLVVERLKSGQPC